MKNIRDLISRNELAQALQQLQTLLENSPLLDEVIQQSARFADIRKQIRLGVVDHADASLTQNQIRAGILELLKEMEAQLTPTPELKAAALRTEHEAAISVLNSKNVVIGSTISAGGDVHIGDKNSTVIQNAAKIYNIERIDNANFS